MRPGTRPDGSEKLRAVDDFTRSGCNPATVVTERLKYDSGDTFLALLRAARKHLGHDLCLWKADIDSAYRRIPVDPSDREFAWVAFLRNGTPVAAQHVGLPFGSVASVHHWDRVGVVSLLSRLSCMTCCVCPRLADSCNRAQVAPPTSVTVCG